LQQKLVPAGGVGGDGFGASVSCSGDTLLVGAPYSGDSGAAYVWARSGSIWTVQQMLMPADAAAGDRFGGAVALSGDAALVGAEGDDSSTDPEKSVGAAYVFARSVSGWSQQQKLTPQGAAQSTALDCGFGQSVALSGTAAAPVEAPSHGGVPAPA
jgi:hypothetical protein